MEFYETPVFTKRIEKLLDDEAFRRLQAALALDPQRGIHLSGNLRKIRWPAKGKGKSGGIRVIYYVVKPDRIYLLFAYPKNEQENLTQEQLKILQALIKEELS